MDGGRCAGRMLNNDAIVVANGSRSSRANGRTANLGGKGCETHGCTHSDGTYPEIITHRDQNRRLCRLQFDQSKLLAAKSDESNRVDIWPLVRRDHSQYDSFAGDLDCP
jgi:hypothetical protein